jgi:carbon storage regulator
MLVLTRETGESIIINGGTPDEIIVTVTAIRDKKVRIGITAPRHVPVHRAEVQRLIEQEEK